MYPLVLYFSFLPQVLAAIQDALIIRGSERSAMKTEHIYLLIWLMLVVLLLLALFRLHLSSVMLWPQRPTKLYEDQEQGLFSTGKVNIFVLPMSINSTELTKCLNFIQVMM